MENAIETWNVGPVKVEVYPDFDPQDPRDWDNLGELSIFHRDYNFPNDLDISPADFTGWDEMEVSLKEKYLIVLPVYMYEHGSIVISCNPFSCPWDSGQVGFVCLSEAQLIEEYGNNDPGHVERADGVLRSEVDTYSQYLNGEVYGYVVTLGEESDSCWGVYEFDYIKEEANRAAQYLLETKQAEAEECLVTSPD